MSNTRIIQYAALQRHVCGHAARDGVRAVAAGVLRYVSALQGAADRHHFPGAV